MTALSKARRETIRGRPPEEADADSYGCHSLSIEALREINIRKGVVLSSPGDRDYEQAQRWREEGPVAHTSQLDCVKNK